ncbi:hypothetical protein ACIQGO_17510 [Streptomyces shenzhenensis]|uniref:hypothetical protein n=1 Tax=Streptomyces shenzhenensis TaxID=943815 RepID=UPI0037F699F2
MARCDTGVIANVLMAAGLLCAALGPVLPVVVCGIALAVTSAPDNRGGAAFRALSAQFFGGATAAPAWLPAYRAWEDWGFALVAVVPVVSVGVVALTGAAHARRAYLGIRNLVDEGCTRRGARQRSSSARSGSRPAMNSMTAPRRPVVRP